MAQAKSCMAAGDLDTSYTLFVLRRPDGKEYFLCLENDGRLILQNMADSNDKITYTADV